MGFRSYDWECTGCGEVAWQLVNVPHGDRPPEAHDFWCEACEYVMLHKRIISLVARYSGEDVFNPEVFGGSFDTCGQKALPEMAPIADTGDRKEMIGAYTERFRSPEWRELKKERASIQGENIAKRKRHAAIQRGENINIRRDKLPGDPKVTA